MSKEEAAYTDQRIEEIATAIMSKCGEPIPAFDDIPWGWTETELTDLWGAVSPYLELDWVDGSVGDGVRFVTEVSGFETDTVAIVHPEIGLVMLAFLYFEPRELTDEVPPKFLSYLRYAVWASHLAVQFEGVVDCTSEADCSALLVGEFQMGRVWRGENIGTVGVTLSHSKEGDTSDAPWRVVLSYTNASLVNSIKDRAPSS